MIGGFGENTLLGGDGDDQLVGGSGSNLIEGFGGNNTIVVRVPTTGQNLILGGNDTNKSTTLEILGLPSAISLHPADDVGWFHH